MTKRPVVFDTDPGVDDFFAWMLLNSSELFDIRAVTTVPGNQSLETVTRNAQGIYKLFGMSGTRLAQGSPRHMIRKLDIPTVHGPTGLGSVSLDPGDVKVDDKRAWDVMYEEAVKAKGELELVAVGPLTNLGIAFFKYPELKTMIKHITIMGGSIDAGNMGPFGEANICHDPHAADIVFKTGIPTTMVGLNALPPCAMTRAEMEPLMPADLDPEIRRVCLELADFRNGFPLCDAVTVAAMIDDSFAQWEYCGVDVETRSELTLGATICDRYNSKRFFSDNEAQNKVKVAITTDRDKYFKMMGDMFQCYCKKEGSAK